MDRTLGVRVARATTTSITGQFERHVSVSLRTLIGSASGGRWGPPGAYEVLYLGRPRESVVVEAYRHLVDDVEGMRPEAVGPRRVLIAKVNVSEILDLRLPQSREEVGIGEAELFGDHTTCQKVGLAAHQLGLHGIIAPAATGLGETLALFERHLPAAELPQLIGDELWDRLPDDPRIPRLVTGSESQTDA
jgi:RES domain-containing protein